jgi:hypothetical protein
MAVITVGFSVTPTNGIVLFGTKVRDLHADAFLVRGITSSRRMITKIIFVLARFSNKPIADLRGIVALSSIIQKQEKTNISMRST